MANGFAFTSLDGPDDEGVRAEVQVQRGTGEVKDIAPHENGKVAQIQIRTEGLKYPQKAWINMDTPQFKAVQEAYDNRTTIDYRIESQRKLKNDSTKEPISRSTPIAELRTSTEVARDNTKTLLVGVNGELTDEAVTHPKEDPSQNGRRPAQDPDIAKAAAQPNAQAQPQTQYQGGGHVGAVEEPPYKEFNSDGSPNLGSYAVQAAVGAELFVRKSLTAAERKFTEDDVVRYASISLAIADKIQAYVTKKGRPNRMATSHTRVRSFVYDVIENFLPIPETQNADGDWVAKVGKLTLDRFNAALKIASEPFDLASLSGAVKAPAKAKEEKPAAAPVAKPEASKPAPVQEKPVTPTTSEDVRKAQPAAPSDNPLANAKSFEAYPPVKIGAVTAQNKMTEETLESFKEFVTESGADFAKLAKLLEHTFGVDKASKVPNEPFEEFLDFYISLGTENFLEVLDYVDTVN